MPHATVLGHASWCGLRVSAPVALVTGAAGFVGSWLLRHVQELGWTIIGVRKPNTPSPALDVDVEWVDVDLRDREATHALLRARPPRYILHLAAVAFSGEARRDPLEALRLNYGALDHLLGGMLRQGLAARLLYVGTGEVYGLRREDGPLLREEDPIAPPNLYSATKAAAEARASLAVERDGLDVVRVRPFNHSGPGRPPQYAESSFARQIVRIERGTQEPVLRVGNLDVVRDFSDVRDVVRAYPLVLEHGERGGVYNVCSGRGWKIRDILNHLISRSDAEPKIEVDPDLFRSSTQDKSSLVGDPARVRALGWTPRHSFEETLDDLLADWRTRA